MNYAIIEASGKQFWIQEGSFYDFDYVPLEPGDKITFNKILLLNHNGKIKIGTPCVQEIKIHGTILRHFYDKKVIIYKDKPKKQARSKRGYRRFLTRIKINEVVSE
uniref:ribosomal protein L21 n=1 Tax=Glaucosphaera vacuolata TaxID=38265 RepID=UPI001FCE21D0|nr:ribosomal protein L21 [Glaucosphaera vacuolata]UNJ18645.1 ribosomal protein L21 [Glaucosphaera vacuolata]